MSTVRTWCAVGAAALGCAAMAGLLTAIAGTPGLRLRGYVSELGAPGQPWAHAYRAAILALAVGLVLLTVAVRPVSGLAAVPLGMTAAAIAWLVALSALLARGRHLREVSDRSYRRPGLMWRNEA